MKKSWLITSLLMSTVLLNAQDAVDTANTEADTQQIISNDSIVTTNETENILQNTEETVLTNDTMTNGMSNNAQATNQYVQVIGYTMTNGDTVFASPMARFEVSGVDEESGLKEILVSVDGSEYAPYKNPISFATEGEHALNYQFVDRVGNISYSKGFSVTVDATSPRVLEMEVSPSPYKAAGVDYVGPNSEFSFRSHDDLTGIAYIEYTTNNTDMVRFETNTTFAQLGYTNTMPVRLSYQATDMVSNVSPIKSRVFVVDASGPSLDVFAKAIEIDGVRYISSKDRISIEAFDNETKVAEILYAINDDNFMKYDDQIGVFIKNSGQYTVRAKAIDVVGNESAIVEYMVSVDMLAPTGEAVYIGEVRSIEYDPLAEKESATQTPDQVNQSDTVEMEEIQNTASTDAVSTTTNQSLEVPSGSEVDAMQSETVQ